MVDTRAESARGAPTRQDVLTSWYRENPGLHRCRDVARAIGWDTHEVARVSYVLMGKGDIIRHRLDVEGRSRPLTVYGIDPATPRKKSA